MANNIHETWTNAAVLREGAMNVKVPKSQDLKDHEAARKATQKANSAARRADNGGSSISSGGWGRPKGYPH
jgi:hypothetical protein